MKKFGGKIKENRNLLDTAFLFFIALVLAIPMFHPKNDLFFDDGSQHLMRAYGSYQSMAKNGTQMVISDFANGFGYSWNLFYGSLSTNMMIAISLIVGAFNLGFQITMLLILFFAGILMYKFIKEMTENQNTALLAGMIYMTSPYFFTDIFIRHAVGEAFAFIFIPMVFLGLYHLFNTEKNHYYLIFGTCGLILSHNISTVLTAVFAGIYCLINLKNLATTRVKKGLIVDLIWILCITSFYWMPLLECKYTTNYRVYEENAMATQENFLAHQVEGKNLFTTENDVIYIFEIGLPIVLMLAFSIMAFRKLTENKKEYLFFLISGIISCFMATEKFPWKWLPDSFYIIQFPWRMLLFSSFFLAIVASINMATVIKKFNIKDVWILGAICILCIFSKHSVIPYTDIVPITEQYESMKISGQNDEWLPGMGRLEYLPSRAYHNTFYIATREDGILAIEGTCQIQKENKMGTHMTAQIAIQNENAKLELPYLYYPGYTVRLDGIILETFETENGFLGCTIEQNEDGKLEIEYTGTKIMNITKILSIFAFAIFIIYVWKKH